MTKPIENQLSNDDPRNLELYKIAAQTRAQEIGFYWQRSNYLLVLNTAIAAGLVALKGDEPVLGLMLSVVGFFVSLIWFLVNIGGKFWQARWEQCVEEAEGRYAPDAKVFTSDWPYMEAQAQRNLSLDLPKPTSSQVRVWLYKLRMRHRDLIILRPSVSEMITLLSVLFMGFWFLAILHAAYRVVAGFAQATPYDGLC